MSEVSARGLARSSLQMNVAQLSQMAGRMLLIPLVIARLGLAGYGVWALLFSLCAYAIALNAGMVWTYVRRTAELDLRRDYAAMSEAVSSGSLAVSLVAGTGFALLWYGRATILPWIGVPAEMVGEAQVVFALLATGVLIETGPGCASYVLAGLQRTDLQYRIQLAASLCEFILSLSLLTAGFGLTSLAVGFTGAQTFAACASWFLCRRMRPALHLSPLRARASGLRQLMPLGVRLQAIVLLNTVARESVRLSISALYGASALGAYQLADRLLFVAKSPAAAVLSPLMPAFSNLAAAGQREKTTRLFALASTLTVVGGTFALLFAFVFADRVLFAMTGRELPTAASTLRVLAPAELAVLMTGVAIAALRAAGTVGLEARLALTASALALAGVALGEPLGGFAGSIIGLALGRALAALWFLARLPLGLRSNWGGFSGPALLLPITAVGAAELMARALPAPTGRWQALFVLGGVGAASAAALGAGVWLLVFSGVDRTALLRGARRR